jgi:hypothetical protein
MTLSLLPTVKGSPMRRLTIGAALAALLLPEPASAQVFVGPSGGFVTGGAVGLGFHSRRFNVGVAFGRTNVYQYGLVGPPLFSGFYGPPFGPFLPPPVPIVLAPRVIVVPPPALLPPALPAREEPERVEAPRPIDPARFIVIRPDKPNENKPARGKPVEALPPARVAKKKPPAPAAAELAAKPGELPLAMPKADRLAEVDRQTDLGRAAFDRGLYGVALESFRRAAELAPDAAMPRFLLAQAQFAAGKYDAAAASVAAGMKLRPDWPASPFRSRDLYRLTPPAFDAHLKDLRDALVASPDDPRLLFLLGVQLWFDDRHDEARPLFDKAARLARDPAPAEAFLGK